MSNPRNRRLLVPMNIEALVIGKNVSGSKWVDLKPAFNKFARNQFLGQYLEYEPFSSTVTNLHASGVHLHWALPDGLTHGAKENTGEWKFPQIPNRWVIVRLWDQGTGPKLDLQVRAWVLESDTITDDGSATSFPRQQASDSYRYQVVRVGKRFELNQWPGEPASRPPDASVSLTAVGYGNPAFGAFYPECKTVLGFHDRDLDALKNVSLAYFVAGWYSSASKDPLNQALTGAAQGEPIPALEEFLKKMQWTYGEFDAALHKFREVRGLKADLEERKQMVDRLSRSAAGLQVPPSNVARPGVSDGDPTHEHLQRTKQSLVDGEAELKRQIQAMELRIPVVAKELQPLEEALPWHIVCHGAVVGIAWESKDKIYNSGIPSGDAKISVADNAIEALAALFQGKLLNDHLVKLLEAFQYDLLSELEKPGGNSFVDQQFHERAFRPLNRGIRWNVTEGEASRARHDEKAPMVPGDVWMRLEELNARQRRINQLHRERDSARSRLYATWYTNTLNSDLAADDRRISESVLTSQLTNLKNEIDRLTGEIAALEEQGKGVLKSNVKEQLKSSLNTFLPGYEVQELEEPRFWKPNDPVVLLAGPPFQRSLRHGDDGRYRADGRLLCRLNGSEITRIRVTIPNAIKDVEFGPSDLDQWCNPFLHAKGPIAEKAADLFREFLFLTLDQKRAGIVARSAYERNQAGLADAHKDKVDALSRDFLEWWTRNLKDDASKSGLDGSGAPTTSTTFALAGNQFAFPSPIAIKRWRQNPWLPIFLQWQASWVPTYSDPARAMENWDLSSSGTAFEWRGTMAAKPKETYKGTALLTAAASLNFSERLRKYNLTHDIPGLVKLQTAVRSLNILCQSLAGFTDGLLTRQGRLELRSIPIFDKVKDIDWMSPLSERAFYPIRAGHLKLDKLRVVDAFGQIFDLGDKPLNAILRPADLSGPDVRVRLEPRISQPARLSIQWLPAHESKWNTGKKRPSAAGEFSPLCGWILPNFLDKALMIYDAEGNALGALQAVKKMSWDQGAGAERVEIEGFHWVDIPGSDKFYFGLPPSNLVDRNPLGASANPHLREFVNGLLSLSRQSGDAFAGLLEKMNEALSVAGGAGSAQDPNLALLIGKPVALVRASIALELDGMPAYSQNWNDLNKTPGERTGGIDKVKFPIRLGDRRAWNGLWVGEDGLIGFFQNQDYSSFYPAYGLTGRNDSYNRFSVVPEISTAAPLDLTLLMDLSRGVCATTGILPRQVFEFPYRGLTATLENKQIIFYAGPVVTPRSPANKSEIRMPEPSDLYGQWSWTHHPEVKVWKRKDIVDTQKDQGTFSEAEIVEGWLKLVTAPLSLGGFSVKPKDSQRKVEKKDGKDGEPDEFKVSRGDEVILTWTISGADKVELWRVVTLLFQSQRQPLPTQYLVTADKDTSFTLMATARMDRLSRSGEAPAEEKITKTIKLTVS